MRAEVNLWNGSERNGSAWRNCPCPDLSFCHLSSPRSHILFFALAVAADSSTGSVHSSSHRQLSSRPPSFSIHTLLTQRPVARKHPSRSAPSAERGWRPVAGSFTGFASCALSSTEFALPWCDVCLLLTFLFFSSSFPRSPAPRLSLSDGPVLWPRADVRSCRSPLHRREEGWHSLLHYLWCQGRNRQVRARMHQACRCSLLLCVCRRCVHSQRWQMQS